MNKTRTEIDKINAKIIPLRNQILALEDAEREKIQIPRLYKMIGLHLRSTYEDSSKTYGKILELIKTKRNTYCFILEMCSIEDDGRADIGLNYIEPYLNKEWWDSKVNMTGLKKCSEKEYNSFKKRVLNEIDTAKSMKTHLIKNN